MNSVFRYHTESRKSPGKNERWLGWLFIIILTSLFVLGCRGALPPPKAPEPPPSKHVPRMGYAIQAGAFSILGNAVRLAKSLQEKGLDAYCFPDAGLFKVRFGNYPTQEPARKEAEELLALGIITEFYLVGPEDYPGVKDFRFDEEFLRENIVRTAKSYLGLPYQWGGSNPDEGFDCSGLVMAAYQLNGLALPRTSQQQWDQGTPVTINRISKADLLFFSGAGKGKVSHVALHTGGGRFIHAPGTGKTIRSESLSNPYFRRTFVGARTYL